MPQTWTHFFCFECNTDFYSKQANNTPCTKCGKPVYEIVPTIKIEKES